ncbi:MAG: hypothetical protein FOGNACKC_03268 [Anaerolineae bacterium]|nr:hypothetical protein [Anaerolineae bacterium]
MEFKALRVPSLTEDVASKLETLLGNLPGVERFSITLDTQELHIVFDEEQLTFRTLVQEMSTAGCSLKNIDAAILL